MKKINCIFFGCILFLITACQKDHLQAGAETNSLIRDNKISQSKASQLKAWYETHRKTVSGTQNRDEYSLYPPVILWETGVFLPADQVYIFQMKEFEEGEINTSNIFAVYLNEDGDISTGEYIFTKTAASTSGMTLTEIWTGLVKVFDGEDIPIDFEASQIRYGMDGEWLYSKHISNQAITNTEEKIKSEEKVPIQLPEEGIMICIDSWWVTWDPDTGVILNILYLGSECHTYGGSGSGGGGGGGGNSSLCYTPEEALYVVENSTSTNVNEWTYENGISYNDGSIIRQPRNASFKFATINLAINPYQQPSYSAMFTGIRYKIIPPNSDPWKWESLTYDQTVQSGGQIPMCSGVQMSATVSVLIASDKKQALVAVDYTAIISATCNALNQSNSTQVGLPIVGTVTGIALPGY